MQRLRRLVEFLLFVYIVLPLFATCQNRPDQNQGPLPRSAAADLALTRVGNGKLSNGHSFAFRVYTTPDGMVGVINFAHFTSIQVAQAQIAEWLKHAEKVTNREHDVEKHGHMVNDRIEAVMTDPKSNKEQFLIIRRDRQDCYLIQSFSSEIAILVENTIDAK